jgi:DNA-binding NarL/FixJ family response regulator
MKALPPRATRAGSGILSVEDARLLPPPLAGEVSVLIVDDHLMFAEGLARVLADEPDIRPVGAVAGIDAALAIAREVVPDLVLIDVELSGEDALAGVMAFRTELPRIGVLVLTSTDSPELLSSAIRAGVRGYVSKYRHIDRLVALIRQAASGEMVLTDETVPALLGRRKAASHGEEDVRRAFGRLTPREMETLTSFAAGRTTAETAAALHISPLTVRSHAKGILSKLGVHSKLEAVTLAIRHGLIDMDRSA